MMATYVSSVNSHVYLIDVPIYVVHVPINILYNDIFIVSPSISPSYGADSAAG